MSSRFNVFCDENGGERKLFPMKKSKRRKRKHIPHSKRPVEFVENRNRRERERVKMLNDAFEDLRKHVPYCEIDDRIPKADILLAAADYIFGLQEMIDNHDRNLNFSLATQNGQPRIPHFPVATYEQQSNHPNFSSATKDEKPKFLNFPAGAPDRLPSSPNLPLATHDGQPGYTDFPSVKRAKQPHCLNFPAATHNDQPNCSNFPLATHNGLQNNSLFSDNVCFKTIPSNNRGVGRVLKENEGLHNQINLSEDIVHISEPWNTRGGGKAITQGSSHQYFTSNSAPRTSHCGLFPSSNRNAHSYSYPALSDSAECDYGSYLSLSTKLHHIDSSMDVHYEIL